MQANCPHTKDLGNSTEGLDSIAMYCMSPAEDLESMTVPLQVQLEAEKPDNGSCKLFCRPALGRPKFNGAS